MTRPRGVAARAPLRLGLAGGGSDVDPYCATYGGQVLNATINRYAYAFVETLEPGELCFHAADRGFRWSGWADELDAVPAELALHRAVVRRVLADHPWVGSLSIRLTTIADAPPGSGLGTSSTLVVAMIQALQEYLRLPLGEYEIARLAYEIERVDCGLSGGKQDHYAAAFGGFNLMEFMTDGRVIVNPLRLHESVICQLESSLVLYFTGVSRESARIIEEQKLHVEQDDDAAIQATHAVKAQAVTMKEALLRGSLADLAQSLHESWLAKRRMATQISNAGIDAVYEAAQRAGARAGKISGAGGGGFMMFIVDPMRRVDVLQTLSGFGGQLYPCSFQPAGARAWRTQS